jgi:PAS domain-containing protein
LKSMTIGFERACWRQHHRTLDRGIQITQANLWAPWSCRFQQVGDDVIDLRRRQIAVERSADIVVITDIAGRIEYVNPAFYQLTGFERDEVIGKTPKILKSGEHTSAFYRELWERSLRARCFVASW